MTSRILGASLFLTTALSLASLSRPRPFTPLLRRLSTLLPAVPPTPRRDPKGKILAGNDPTRPNNGPDVALMMDPPTGKSDKHCPVCSIQCETSSCVSKLVPTVSSFHVHSETPRSWEFVLVY